LFKLAQNRSQKLVALPYLTGVDLEEVAAGAGRGGPGLPSKKGTIISATQYLQNIEW
jgi:hypothetical protein